MRPFCSFLYSLTVGYSNLETQIAASDDLHAVIDLWVMFLLLMETEPLSFRRSISTFGVCSYRLMVNLDASLTGLGLIVSLVDYHSNEEAGTMEREEIAIVAVVGYDFAFDLGDDSGFQNTVEFIAIVSASLLLTSLGMRGESVLVQGDNTSSLSWVKDERFRAGRSMAAAILFMQLQQCNEIPIAGTEHIAGAINPSDPLSRGRSPEELGYAPEVIYDFRNNPSIDSLITRLNPTREVCLRDDLANLWQANQSCIDTLKGTGGGWNPR